MSPRQRASSPLRNRRMVPCQSLWMKVGAPSAPIRDVSLAGCKDVAGAVVVAARSGDRGQTAGRILRPVPQSPGPEAWILSKLRIGLVGAGRVGERLARDAGGLESAAITVVADADPERARQVAALVSAAAVESIEDVLARSDVDAVYLAVPTFLDTMLAQAAARAGKHVLIVPPGATDADEALRSLETARECDVRLAVAFADRYLPVWQRVREMVTAGAIGTVRALHVQCVRAPGAGWGDGWRARRLQAGGGVLPGEVLPLLDAAHWATGLRPVRAFAEHGGGTPLVEVEDLATMTIGYRDGATGSVAAAWTAPGGAGPQGAGHRIIGSTGQLWTDGERLWAYGGAWAEVRLEGAGAPSARLIDAFARAVAAGEPSPVADDAGLEAMKLIQAGYASRRLGRAIRMEDVLQKVVPGTWNTVG